MNDLISRKKAFEYFVALWECIGTIADREEWEDVCMTTANEIPSADRPVIDKDYLIDLILGSVYDGEECAKLLDLVDRPQGEWVDAEIPTESGGAMPIQVCNLCKTFYPLAYTGGGHRFCPNCGARMKGADDGTN